VNLEGTSGAGLRGARVLVTGGTRGIGAATVRSLAAAGAEVVVAARTAPDQASAAAPADTALAAAAPADTALAGAALAGAALAGAALAGAAPAAAAPADTAPARFVAADVATADGVAALAEQALNLLGGIDILVSNAGAQTHRPEGVLHFSDEDWQRDLDINLLSAVQPDRALLPAVIAQGRGGSIVHVGSNAARMPRPASLPYTAAKAAFTAYSKGLAREAGPHGIRVNVVLPGLIRTEALDTRMASLAERTGATPESVLAGTIAALGIPLERAGTADDGAQLIACLVAPAAAYLTGSQFTVDGGALATV
jgi:NAD(P)-dependent dehydrogenase (short-subunit alcohol dehydrogenase family)